ncbi:MAG: hypothetical protein ACKOOL_09325 [Novosphingobium sp.]
MIRHTIPLALAATLALAPAPAPAHVIETTARLGQWVQVAPGVSVEPLRVIEDSRCPRDVTCVWAGRFVLSAKVRDHGRVQTVRLTLGQPTLIGRGRLTLDQVSPERSAKGVNARRYRFGISYSAGAIRRGDMQPMLEPQKQ